MSADDPLFGPVARDRAWQLARKGKPESLLLTLDGLLHTQNRALAEGTRLLAEGQKIAEKLLPRREREYQNNGAMILALRVEQAEKEFAAWRATVREVFPVFSTRLLVVGHATEAGGRSHASAWDAVAHLCLTQAPLTETLIEAARTEAQVLVTAFQASVSPTKPVATSDIPSGAPDERPTSASVLTTSRGYFRLPVFAILQALHKPAKSWSEIQRRAESDAPRRFSRPMQDAGLIVMEPDGTWMCTAAGQEALRRRRPM